jgi:large subunit ribosomal protein L7/L12
MPIVQLILSTIVGAGGAAFAFKYLNAKQERAKLEAAFYQLIAAQSGRISLIQLAAIAQIPAAATKEYLEEQVRIFDAYPSTDDRGDVYYNFPPLEIPLYLRSGGWESQGSIEDDWD